MTECRLSLLSTHHESSDSWYAVVAVPMLIFISDRIHANAADATYLLFSALWRRRGFTG